MEEDPVEAEAEMLAPPKAEDADPPNDEEAAPPLAEIWMPLPKDPEPLVVFLMLADPLADDALPRLSLSEPPAPSGTTPMLAFRLKN